MELIPHVCDQNQFCLLCKQEICFVCQKLHTSHAQQIIMKREFIFQLQNHIDQVKKNEFYISFQVLNSVIHDLQ